MSQPRTNKERGFTLIELLVIITVIGILSAVIAVSVSNIRQSSRDAERQTELSDIKLLLELFASEHDRTYPQNEAGDCADPSGNYSKLVSGSDFMSYISNETKAYDPINTGEYQYHYCGCAADGTTPTSGVTNPVTFEINAALERKDSIEDNANDGGNQSDRYELGTALTCLAP